MTKHMVANGHPTMQCPRLELAKHPHHVQTTSELKVYRPSVQQTSGEHCPRSIAVRAEHLLVDCVDLQSQALWQWVRAWPLATHLVDLHTHQLHPKVLCCALLCCAVLCCAVPCRFVS